MKPSSIFKVTAIVILIIFSKASSAQITTTGMAIQGIARDASDNAIKNTPIGIKFTVHYTNRSNANVDLSPVTVSITTDAFGVFSYVLDMSAIETSLFYDFQLKLKIEQTSPSTNLISDENLNFVPYAVSASNGVPSGTIMPYVGSTAPRGWALCDGSAIPITSLTLTLRTLLGRNNTPDLRGMFLRGAGINGNNAYRNNVGPDLGVVQTDDLKSHLHEINLTTSEDGNHRHKKSTNDQASTDGDGAIAWNDTDGEGAYLEVFTDFAGSHRHTVSGNTALTGVLETRPINYGVTYIIKL
jgi:microcystin-dependent protein